jgi:hypothetical protein
MEPFAKTAWFTDDGYEGYVYGPSKDGKWSFEIIDTPDFMHPRDKISIAEGSGYESQDETLKAMSKLMGGREWRRLTLSDALRLW